jgi:hypothetical protein
MASKYVAVGFLTMLKGQQREIFCLGFLHGIFPSIPQWTSPGLIVIYFLYSQNYANLTCHSGCLPALALNQRSLRPRWNTDKRFVQNLAFLFQKLLWNSSLPGTKVGRRKLFSSAMAIPQLEGCTSAIRIPQLFEEILHRNRNSTLSRL